MVMLVLIMLIVFRCLFRLIFSIVRFSLVVVNRCSVVRVLYLK